MTRKFNMLSERATDEDGEVVNLTEEFFEKAVRGFPHPLDDIEEENDHPPRQKTAASKKAKPVDKAVQAK